MAPLESCANLLQEAAYRLTGSQALPVDLGSICDGLGVKVVNADSGNGSGKTYLVKSKHGAEIRLNCGVQGFESFCNPVSRYLIAHELGHLILDSQKIPRPLGKSEYWKHENLCNYFAGLLLLPEGAIKADIESVPRNLRLELDLCKSLANTACVPWETVALRFVHFRPSVAMFSLKLVEYRMPTFAFRVSMSTCGNQQGIHTFIKDIHRIGQALIRVPNGTYLELDPKQFADIRYLAFLKPAVAAVALRTKHAEMRLAVRFPDSPGRTDLVGDEIPGQKTSQTPSLSPSVPTTLYGRLMEN